MENIIETVAMAWDWSMAHLLYINLILSVAIVFFQRRDPKAVWTWLLCLYFIPVFGFLFYLLLCQDYRKNRMFRIKEVEDRLQYTAKNQEEYIKRHALDQEDPMTKDYGDLVLYNLETSGAVLTIENELHIFTDGKKKFQDLCEELKKAKRYIHIQYYIIKHDEVFGSMIPILREKAKQGVEVRILYDGMGGRFMPRRIWKELKQCGIRVGEFFPAVLGRLQLRVNYRNHRKIVVIDGQIGYVGGFNIGREYLGLERKFGYWRDTHLKIYGEAALSLQIRFAMDWNYATGENLFRNAKYFMAVEEHELEEEQAQWMAWGITHRPLPIQIVASGPDSRVRQIRDNYLQLFHKARHHIYIQTPYFVPDDAVLSALEIAARSGVEVRLMIPCMPDHPFVYWATYSYMGDLLDAGARCYTYENGFLHAKGVMVDGRVCSYGTANMDIRSFELNFEVNATIFDEEATQQLEAAFLEDLPLCHEVTLKEYHERGMWIRVKEQCSRLLSPLL